MLELSCFSIVCYICLELLQVYPSSLLSSVVSLICIFLTSSSFISFFAFNSSHVPLFCVCIFRISFTLFLSLWLSHSFSLSHSLIFLACRSLSASLFGSLALFHLSLCVALFLIFLAWRSLALSLGFSLWFSRSLSFLSRSLWLSFTVCGFPWFSFSVAL